MPARYWCLLYPMDECLERDRMIGGNLSGPSAVLIISFVWAMLSAPQMAIGSKTDEGLSCGYFSTDPNDRSGPPIHFYADLSDDAEHLPTESPGVGRADFVLERDTLKLSWSVRFKDLTSQTTGLHIHGPVPAEGLAPPIFDLAPELFMSPVEGEKILSQGEVAYFIQHLVYVNLHTTRYPEGELRGPVRKIPPKC